MPSDYTITRTYRSPAHSDKHYTTTISTHPNHCVVNLGPRAPFVDPMKAMLEYRFNRLNLSPQPELTFYPANNVEGDTLVRITITSGPISDAQIIEAYENAERLLKDMIDELAPYAIEIADFRTSVTKSDNVFSTELKGIKEWQESAGDDIADLWENMEEARQAVRDITNADNVISTRLDAINEQQVFAGNDINNIWQAIDDINTTLREVRGNVGELINRSPDDDWQESLGALRREYALHGGRLNQLESAKKTLYTTVYGDWDKESKISIEGLTSRMSRLEHAEEREYPDLDGIYARLDELTKYQTHHNATFATDLGLVQNLYNDVAERSDTQARDIEQIFDRLEQFSNDYSSGPGSMLMTHHQLHREARTTMNAFLQRIDMLENLLQALIIEIQNDPGTKGQYASRLLPPDPDLLYNEMMETDDDDHQTNGENHETL